MNTREHLTIITNIANGASVAAANANLGASNALYDAMLERIFEQGKNSAGAGIGNYEKYDFYATRNDFVRKSAFNPNRGKNSNKKSKNKTFYTPDGWAGVRKANGRQVGYVDLEYSGSLKTSIRLIRERPDLIKLAILGEDSVSKALNLERLYKSRIFVPTNEEVQKYYSEFRLLLSRSSQKK